MILSVVSACFTPWLVSADPLRLVARFWFSRYSDCEPRVWSSTMMFFLSNLLECGPFCYFQLRACAAFSSTAAPYYRCEFRSSCLALLSFKDPINGPGNDC
jgi:hypothetical protein